MNNIANKKVFQKITALFFIMLAAVAVGFVIKNQYEVRQVRSKHSQIFNEIINESTLPPNYSLISSSINQYKSKTSGCLTDLPCRLGNTKAQYSFSTKDRTREQTYRDIKKAFNIKNADKLNQFDQNIDKAESTNNDAKFSFKLLPYTLDVQKQNADNICLAIKENSKQNDCRYEVFRDNQVDRVDLEITISE